MTGDDDQPSAHADQRNPTTGTPHPHTSIDEIIVRRTLRVPAPCGPSGDGAAATRQFDAALMSVGFKLSDQLFAELSARDTGTVMDTAVAVLGMVRRMVGDHVQHNVYFRDFPRNVPDTIEFWTACLLRALADLAAADQVSADTLLGTLNLLSLPGYGRYQHSYREMLENHHQFIESASDRLTVLHPGGTSAEEATRLYHSLAAATTPGNDDHLQTLKALARYCLTDECQPRQIPVRENRALINEVRASAGAPLLVDTVTDILRLACALSDGDVTLVTTTRFRALRRPTRRAMLSALDTVVRRNPAALGDVHQHRERWKRLGERLHPHEFHQWPNAAEVFAVARGEHNAPSLTASFEQLVTNGETVAAAALLQKTSPGMLFRAADQLLRYGTLTEQTEVAGMLAAAAANVSGRVLLSLREHLSNRLRPGQRRVFVNRTARGHVEYDTRAPIDPMLW
ncbi:hypothetical protein [Nocardia carnea]|uniref:hypothetical protein n=1 Tax=Nocardia carnea TaxID=37328 RepID=UPI0024577B98|nr:hypothetical protein [Nocardia carnea]